jgi:hypothetical protein
MLRILAMLFSKPFKITNTLRINVTTKPGTKVQLTKCNTPWPYKFDCFMINNKIRCLKKKEQAFSGFPPCKEGIKQNALTDSNGKVVFADQEPGYIYSVKSGRNEIRFIGHYAPLMPKPRKFGIKDKIIITIESV